MAFLSSPPRTLWVIFPALLFLSTLFYFHREDASQFSQRLRPAITAFQSALVTPEPTQKCPSLHGPLSRIIHAAQVCTTMPSASPAFSVQLCHDPAVCNAFTLRIERTDKKVCAAFENDPRPLSLDPETHKWMKNDRGPDSFEVRTDGAERTGTVESVYEKGCKYRFDVALRNAGPIWLTAWQIYENYGGMDELDPDWPPVIRAPLFRNPVPLSICSSECQSMWASQIDPSTVSADVYPPPPPAQLGADKIREMVPACGGKQPITGSYLPAHPLDVMYPPAQLPTSWMDNQLTAGHYQFMPHGCKWKHGGLRFNDPRSCTKKTKKILVIGDSHGRVMTDALYHRFNGDKEITTDSEKKGKKSHKVGNFDMHFLWDEFAKDPEIIQCNTPVGPVSELDALVVTIGAHHMETNATSLYMSDLTAALDKFSSCPGHPRLIFVSAPAIPPRQDKWMGFFHDHRTNPRLWYWRNQALAAASARGWSTIDQYHLTLPFVWEVLKLDSAHYLSTNALDAIVDELIGKSGLCDAVST